MLNTENLIVVALKFDLPPLHIFLGELQKVAGSLPVRFFAFAYDDHPSTPDYDMYSVGDHEYLMPIDFIREKGRIISSTPRPDLMQRIVLRPIDHSIGQPTKDVTKMELSNDVPDDVREALTEESNRRYKKGSYQNADLTKSALQ